MMLDETRIKGVFVAQISRRDDHRGSFARLFCERDLAAAIGNRRIVQVNHSVTVAAGAVRGLHFQHPPHAEMKIVRCLRGRVMDVAVDIRRGSPTYLQYHAEELSSGNARMMIIPEGFAHGFQALEQDVEMLYLHTAFYAPESEGGLRHDDPALGIRWPMPVTDVSGRDASHALIGREFEGVEVT